MLALHLDSTSGLSTVLLEFLSRAPVTSASPLSHIFRITSPIGVVRLPHVRLLQRLGLDFATPVFDSNDGITTFMTPVQVGGFVDCIFLSPMPPETNRFSIGIPTVAYDFPLCTTSSLIQALITTSRFLRVVSFGSHVARLTHLLVQVSLIPKC
jgi:hypothetical protein